MTPAVDAIQLRARRPLTAQEGLLAGDLRSEAYTAVLTGGTAELEVFAGLLGRQLATPLLTPPAKTHPDLAPRVTLPRVRPVVYRMGAEAVLMVAAARMGLDADPYLSLMEEARAAEAAIPSEEP